MTQVDTSHNHLKSTFRHIVDHPHCTTTHTESGCFGLYNTDSHVTSLQQGLRCCFTWAGNCVLCIIIVCFPFCASPIFQNSEVSTLLSKHCSHKWLWEITILLYMRSTHCTSRKCVYRVTVGISSVISHCRELIFLTYSIIIISAKEKKASASLRKPSRSGRCWLGVLRLFAIC